METLFLYFPSIIKKKMRKSYEETAWTERDIECECYCDAGT